MNKKLHTHHSGTTLIEVVVALMVIAITIEGSSFVTSIAFRASESSKTRLIASNLAYEGIGVVAKAINTNKIRFNDPKCWNFDMDNKQLPCGEEKKLYNKYRLEDYVEKGMLKTKLQSVTKDLFIPDQPSSQNKTLNKEYLISRAKVGIDEFYTYVDKQQNPNQEELPKETKFYRMIKITYNKIGGEEDELKAVSTVAWNEGGVQKQISVEAVFYNDFSHD